MLENQLSPKARNLMIQEVIDQDQPISTVSKKYNVSRVTLYKWLKRYKKDISSNKEPDMSSRKRKIDKYWHQSPDEYENAVLSLVNKHPEWGIRTLVRNLPKVGNTPIVGHHGVQNILRRHNLSTYEDRLTYVKKLRTPVIRSIEDILKVISNFFKIPAEKRHGVIRLSGITLLFAFITIVFLGYINYVSTSFEGTPIVSKIGAIFASTALLMGSFFFLYSLKYYLTLAIVLSYSQKETNKSNSIESRGGFINWLLGINKSNSNKTLDNKAAGLEPNLKEINLKNKPFISVQIPFYNEMNVVERSIHAAISFDYPAYEVILCDDSTDKTTEIIKKRMERYLFEGEKLKTIKGDGWTLTSVEVKPGVTLKHLHRTARSGFKGGALNLALKLTDPRTSFVSIFDADFVPYPDSLELFLKYLKVENDMSEDFSLSNVAAVQGYQWHVLNKSENWITRGVRSEYSGSYVIERSGAEIYGGLKQISGSVYMIRKDILEKIGWGISITEDFELTLKLYEAGYKVVYTPYIQAPAECVSTLKRLIRQRMRWAEGHSFNIKKMFVKLMVNSKVTFIEKLELTYLTPYYLQAFFFLVGTLSWLISETVFKTRLPFWTEFWGWSLVLTNMISLPLLNSVGLFLEESEERDYLGLGSFVALSYILVPFQAYASLKGFIEKEEGIWFRTPKTGRITDTFMRGKFYRFISGIIPGKQETSSLEEKYLALSTANNSFNSFSIKPKNKWYGKVFLSILLIITVSTYSLTKGVPEALATNPATTQYLSNTTTSTLTNSWKVLSTVPAQNSGTSLPLVRNDIGDFQYYPGTTNNATGTKCGSTPNGRGWILDTPFGGDGGNIASGTWSFFIYESDNQTAGVGHFDVCVYKITVSSGAITSNTLLYDSNSDSAWSTATDTWNGGVSSISQTTTSQSQFNFSPDEYIYVEYWNHITTKISAATGTSTFYTGESGASDPNIVMPTITIPENALLLLLVVPFIPIITLWA
ncbi:MAG: hypothetical protein UR21_C0023G0002 [Candidatus Woesebacteria bacterium GW2011_GWC2_31_9]|uniref:Glycosyltransferase 2-like domain-containing protein n=1 Tax=Candidatus Woesebacteria bacterium GW2011_GWC2_31_9 TaxID=1618586 RepID=A0A0G0BIF7_9BACT|nr:MAG: hypothetical protein UR21_C0023G0002 [Candidatus Woesebacteria bacterium GW2011_GWC2_31_9]